MRRRRIAWLGALALMSSPIEAEAIEPLQVGPDLERVSLVPCVEILEDREGRLDRGDVEAAPYASRFQPLRGPELNLGLTPSAYWLRFRLHNPTEQTADLVVGVGYADLDHVDFYSMKSDGTVSIERKGDVVPQEHGVLGEDAFAFHVTVRAQRTETYHLRVQSTGPLVIPLHVGELQAYRGRMQLWILGSALFYGMIVALAVYHLFLFSALRESLYLYYVATSACIVVFYLSLDGIAPLLWRTSPLWHRYASETFVTGMILGYLQFSRSFLGTRERRAQDRAAIACTGVVVGAFASGLFLNPWTWRAVLIATFASSNICIVACTIIRLRQGFLPARLYLVAWAAMLLIMIAVSVAALGLIPNFVGMLVAFKAALLAERSLSALALADRFRLLRAEAVTSRLEREAEEARHRQLVEHSPLGVVVVGRGLEILHVNSEILRMFGIASQASVVGAVLDDPIPGLSSKLTEAVRAAMEQRRVELIEMEWAPSGPPLSLRVHCAPLYQSQQVIGCQIIVEDVTQERSLRDQLHQAQKLEAVARLAAGVAHDFNNYLTAIRGFGEIIADRAADKESGELAEYVLDAAARAEGVTRQLLAFSRQEVISPQVLDVGSRVRGMQNLLRRMLGEDVDLSIEAAREPLAVHMDPAQLEQVLLNLVVNAKDAMPTGGRARIGLRRALHAGRPGVELSVSDTGQGMDAATQAHIFDPFFTTKEIGRGTGLGLATISGIVHQYGGRIEVDSAVGKGTKFRIVLPAVAAPVASELRAEVREGPSPHPRRREESTILVVDDEEAVRLLACRVLGGVGYAVLEAASPQDALRLASQNGGAIDLLLTDVVLPGMTGIELSARISELHGRLPTIFMSGYAERPEIEEIVSSDRRLLSKPFSPRELASLVDEAFSADPRRDAPATRVAASS